MRERPKGCESKDQVLEPPLALTSSAVLSRLLGHGLLICITKELGFKKKGNLGEAPSSVGPGPCPRHPQGWGRALGFPGGRGRRWEGRATRPGLGWSLWAQSSGVG